VDKYLPYGNNSVAVDTNIMKTDDIMKVVDSILAKTN
jgi:hypothetical protein